MKKVEPQNISKTGKLLTISSAKVTQSPTLQQDAYIKRNFFGFSKKKKGMILKAQVKLSKGNSCIQNGLYFGILSYWRQNSRAQHSGDQYECGLKTLYRHKMVDPRIDI